MLIHRKPQMCRTSGTICNKKQSFGHTGEHVFCMNEQY